MIDIAQFWTINKHILHQIITNVKRDMNCLFHLANYSFILSKPRSAKCYIKCFNMETDFKLAFNEYLVAYETFVKMGLFHKQTKKTNLKWT